MSSALAKPFRTPLLSKPLTSANAIRQDNVEPEAKRRRIDDNSSSREALKVTHLVFKASGVSSLPRKPLVAVVKPVVAAEAPQPTDGGVEGYYNVLWFVMKAHIYTQHRN